MSAETQIGNRLALVTRRAPAENDPPIDPEKINRTEAEWWDSVASYLTFRDGCEWRKNKPRYRQSPEHLYYLAGLRLMHRIKNLDPPPCTCKFCEFRTVRKAVQRAEVARMLAEQIASYENGRNLTSPPSRRPA